jgi:hypothetical protein
MLSTRSLRARLPIGVALLVLAGLMVGCNNADQPKLAEAPAIDPGPPKEPPKIPGQKKPYQATEGYAKYMSGGGKPKPGQ